MDSQTFAFCALGALGVICLAPLVQMHISLARSIKRHEDRIEASYKRLDGLSRY